MNKTTQNIILAALIVILALMIILPLHFLPCVSWLDRALYASVVGIVFAITTYTGGDLVTGWKQVKISADKYKTNRPKGSSWKTWFNRFPFFGWMLIAILLFNLISLAYTDCVPKTHTFNP